MDLRGGGGAMSSGIFIIGTDTGVGKTVAAFAGLGPPPAPGMSAGGK